ncbi:SRPBCC family protein [Knoellia sp. CPCC 206435]|uniref:SRPBCC family protein n=1 Tax=Knoellia terrae TaxID=3404797 RepID=UPI003B428063
MTSTSSTPRPTGRREDRDGTAYLVFERTFRAPVEDVWAAVTAPERLERWIGTWTGDPASGSVQFRMTAEGDVPEETVHVDECEEPTRLRMRSARPDDQGLLWVWQVDLVESGGVTTLTFAQEVVDVTLAESVGPGWDYYLDRLVAAEAGGDLGAIDFDAYFPAMTGHYRAQLA